MKNENEMRRPRGRPRSFDRQRALVAAMETFWRLGYEGASIVDLTEAMGVTPQSLYTAFGSKADLYRDALEEYRKQMGQEGRRALDETTDVVEALRGLLLTRARLYSSSTHPLGCMISAAVLTCASENKPIADHLRALRQTGRATLQARIERAIREGDLKADTDAESLARFLAAIIQGMAVQARDGANFSVLEKLVRLAMEEVLRHRREAS
jgi:AcrR family transcriptional regulator